MVDCDEDGPLNGDELPRVRAGEAAIASGAYVTLEELRRKLAQRASRLTQFSTPWGIEISYQG